ncbi:Protein of unknown function [Limimonas halophila]|uniref:DUF559 domain-containing protein n=2 Tax=Limimonas halophila TaxID=1082479 RepID=A0A1G7V2G2_9PROT|nr:Protein of unknown function [Limimonas halophila]
MLWRHVRRRQVDGVKFRREQPIGPYVVDFVCHAYRLVIEVDGGQHAAKREADAHRTRYLEACGFTVLRFWNNEVLEDPAAVVATIRRHMITS